MNSRVDRLRSLLIEHKLDALALNPGPSLVYLTGLQLHLMERPSVALFCGDGRIGLIVPALEGQKLVSLPFKAEIFPFGDDPAEWPEVFTQALKSLRLGHADIGLEPIRMRVLELRYLENSGCDLRFVDGSHVLEALRIQKDSDEIAKMRQAAVIAQTALLATLKTVRVGMSEKQIAAELMIQLFRAGCDSEIPFQPIVSTGPNSANPHAVPSERCLQANDVLLIDWGAAFEGYFSDITRVFTVGKVDSELQRIGAIVFAANAMGHASGRAGITAGAIDQAVRTVIEAEGYGEYFTHRTGHGLGLEAHEAPYIYAENKLQLEAGMTFTIEPGIYLPGRFGVRIEDDVVVTAEGLTSLSDLPRQVLPLESFRD